MVEITGCPGTGKSTLFPVTADISTFFFNFLLSDCFFKKILFFHNLIFRYLLFNSFHLNRSFRYKLAFLYHSFENSLYILNFIIAML